MPMQVRAILEAYEYPNVLVGILVSLSSRLYGLMLFPKLFDIIRGM